MKYFILLVLILTSTCSSGQFVGYIDSRKVTLKLDTDGFMGGHLIDEASFSGESLSISIPSPAICTEELALTKEANTILTSESDLREIREKFPNAKILIWEEEFLLSYFGITDGTEEFSLEDQPSAVLVYEYECKSIFLGREISARIKGIFVSESTRKVSVEGQIKAKSRLKYNLE